MASTVNKSVWRGKFQAPSAKKEGKKESKKELKSPKKKKRAGVSKRGGKNRSKRQFFELQFQNASHFNPY
jgi:hypothetical protein